MSEQSVHITVFYPRVSSVHPPQSTGTRVVNLNNGRMYSNAVSMIFEDDDAAIAFAHSIIRAVENAQSTESGENYCDDCSYIAIDSDDMREHVTLNHGVKK